MPIITMTRLVGSGGDEIAHALADRLGYELVDKEKFGNKAVEHGLMHHEFERIDERRPRLLERLFDENQKVYLHIIQTLVYEYACEGNVIIVGRGGMILLKDLPNALHVRVRCSKELRLKNIIAEGNVSEEFARNLLEESDKDRYGYIRHLFGGEREDPTLYDLVLNTAKIGTATAVELIQAAIQGEEIQEAEVRGKTALKRLILAKRVDDALLLDSRIDSRHITVTCEEEGRVVLKGIVYTEQEKMDAEEVARKVEGVRLVENHLVVTVYPTGHLGF